MDGEGVIPDAGRNGCDGADDGHTGGGPPFTLRTPDGPRGYGPVHLIAAPTGVGKTTAAAEFVAREGSTCWLADRLEDVDQAVAEMAKRGKEVGTVEPLSGVQPDGRKNCLHAPVIRRWQEKGYDYRKGFCKHEACCQRQGDPEQCPFLESIDALQEADTVVVTKALAARRKGFFSAFGNGHRKNVILDEDPVGLLRPVVEIGRDDLGRYITTLKQVMGRFEDTDNQAALAQARVSLRAANWCWGEMGKEEPDGQPRAVAVPADLRPGKPVLDKSKRDRKAGRKDLHAAFRRLMRDDPDGTVRNVCRDLFDLLERAVERTVYVTAGQVFFHVKVSVPKGRRVIVLDATADPELLQPLFAPRPVEVLCDERVAPAGRVVQLMDFNGPRSYLNKVPPKLVKIIDALGDRHPDGALVLISHKSCVEKLAAASRHKGRIRTAYFGALRGRNDLEPGPDNRIACHIVAGSPKTTEQDRRRLALAVYGKGVLPFGDLETVRRPVVGRIPLELADPEGGPRQRAWEVRMKGYADPRMQRIYDHTVTAELTHAADRARVLIHNQARVYLLTNEPCPRLWFAEMCFAADLLELTEAARADFQRNYAAYQAKARELLDAGKSIGNADVCRALGKSNPWGWRYWKRFLAECGDALEGERKVRWRGE